MGSGGNLWKYQGSGTLNQRLINQSLLEPKGQMFVVPVESTSLDLNN